MAKAIVLKNTLSVDLLFLGILVPGNDQSTFTNENLESLRNEPNLRSYVEDGTIIINDTMRDLTIPEALYYVWNIPYGHNPDLVGFDVFKGDNLVVPVVGGYHDVLEFGNIGRVKNKFLNNSANHHISSDSAPVAISSGEVVHAAISTEDESSNDFFLQVIINAVKGGAGQYSGGTQIGSNINKPAGVLNFVATGLTGLTFSSGDRISTYILEGSLGNKEAKEPVVRLFIRYD